MMNWLDSHCHINDEAFRDDLDQVLENMVRNDVRKAMIVSSYIEDYEYALKIRDERICFKRSLGIYPGDASAADDEVIRNFASHFTDDDCVAIGEIGLDYYWDKDNRDIQKRIFTQQVRMAQKLDKPIIVHSRDAIDDTYEILKENPVKGVMHCYSDSAEMARSFVELGFYISIAGPVTWKKNEELLRVIRAVPLNRMLIETDCPYLTPAPNRGKRNEPANVVYTGRKICEELGLDEEAFKKQLNENYHMLFGL